MSQDIISFGCPSCGVQLRVPAAMAGVNGPCPACGQPITAPAPPQTEPTLESPAPSPAPEQPSPGPQALPAPQPTAEAFPESPANVRESVGPQPQTPSAALPSLTEASALPEPAPIMDDPFAPSAGADHAAPAFPEPEPIPSPTHSELRPGTPPSAPGGSEGSTPHPLSQAYAYRTGEGQAPSQDFPPISPSAPTGPELPQSPTPPTTGPSQLVGTGPGEAAGGGGPGIQPPEFPPIGSALEPAQPTAPQDFPPAPISGGPTIPPPEFPPMGSPLEPAQLTAPQGAPQAPIGGGAVIPPPEKFPPIGSSLEPAQPTAPQDATPAPLSGGPAIPPPEFPPIGSALEPVQPAAPQDAAPAPLSGGGPAIPPPEFPPIGSALEPVQPAAPQNIGNAPPEHAPAEPAADNPSISAPPESGTLPAPELTPDPFHPGAVAPAPGFPPTGSPAGEAIPPGRPASPPDQTADQPSIPDLLAELDVLGPPPTPPVDSPRDLEPGFTPEGMGPQKPIDPFEAGAPTQEPAPPNRPSEPAGGPAPGSLLPLDTFPTTPTNAPLPAPGTPDPGPAASGGPNAPQPTLPDLSNPGAFSGPTAGDPNLPPGFSAPIKPGELDPSNTLPLSPVEPTPGSLALTDTQKNDQPKPRSPRRLRWPGIVFPLLFLVLAAIMVYLVLDLSELLPHSKNYRNFPEVPERAQSPDPRNARSGPRAPSSPVTKVGKENPTRVPPRLPQPERRPTPPILPPTQPEVTDPLLPSNPLPPPPLIKKPRGSLIEDQDRNVTGEVDLPPMIDLNPTRRSLLTMSEDMKAPAEVLQEFIEAGSLAQRKAVMTKSRYSNAELKKGPLGNPLPEVLRLQGRHRHHDKANSFSEYFFEVSFARNPETVPVPILVQVSDVEGELKVHTDAFLDLYTDELARFGANPVKGTRTFHVVAETYKRCFDDIPDAAEKSFIKLRQHPEVIARLKAYFTTDSDLAREISRPDALPWGQRIVCTVTLEWNTETPGRPFVELLELNGLSWN